MLIKIGAPLACITLLFAVPGAEAATLYVSPNGSGTACSSGSPCSLDHAKSVVKAGDTVILKTGKYNSLDLGQDDSYGTSWNSPVTYLADPNDPNVDAHFGSIFIHDTGDKYLVIDGLHIRPNAGSNATGVVKLRHGVKHIKLLNLLVDADPANQGKFTAIHLSCDASNCIGPEDVLIENCELTGTAEGIEIGGSPKDVQVINNHLHDMAGSAIRISGGSNRVIEGNLIHHQRPEWVPGVHGSGLSIRGSDVVARKNIIYNYGNTRPMRFYQDVAPPGGYRDMLIENNLVYTESGWTSTWDWCEFIDVGPNNVFRNNTFIGGVVIYIDADQDGSELQLYNNIFATNLTINYDYDNNASNTAPAHELWGNIQEAKNVYKSIYSRGCGYHCEPPGGTFSVSSTSVNIRDIGDYNAGFFADQANHDFHLSAGSPAIGFADAAHAPALDLEGAPRDSEPDVGCYEFSLPVPSLDGGPETFDSGPQPDLDGELLHDSGLFDAPVGDQRISSDGSTQEQSSSESGCNCATSGTDVTSDASWNWFFATLCWLWLVCRYKRRRLSSVSPKRLTQESTPLRSAEGRPVPTP